MASLIYICVSRSDLPAGTLQVLDLWPNSSQHMVYEPEGQTKYLNRADSTAVTTQVGGGGAILAAGDLTGIGAYLIDHVEAGGLAAGTAALTAAQANACAVGLLARLDANLSMTLAAVNAVLSAVVAATELTNGGGSASTGVLEELLTVLAGGYYEVPSGSILDTNGTTFNPIVSGSFDTTKFKPTVQGAAFEISNRWGYLSKWKAATFSYKGVVGAAVTVYDDTGAVL